MDTQPQHSFLANRREFPLLLDNQVYLDFEIADKIQRSIGLILKALSGPLGTVAKVVNSFEITQHLSMHQACQVTKQ